MKFTWETAMGTYSGINERKVGNEIDTISFIEHKNLTKKITNVYRLFNGCQELSYEH